MTPQRTRRGRCQSWKARCAISASSLDVSPAASRLRLHALQARAPTPAPLRAFAAPLVHKAIEEGVHPAHSVVAYRDDEPVGLAVGLGGQKGEWELASLFVPPFSRRQGIGRALVAAVEAHFFGAGYRLGACLLSIEPDELSRPRFLRACGWGTPQVTGVVGRSTIALMLQMATTKPWQACTRVPNEYRVVPWTALAAEHREELRASGRIPANPTIDPFAVESGCDPHTSLALLRRAERPGELEPVIAWAITHPTDKQTLRYTLTFMEDAYQSSGLMLPFWFEIVIRQHTLTSFSEFSFKSEMATPRMVRFTQRRFRPWLTELRYSCIVLKAMPT